MSIRGFRAGVYALLAAGLAPTVAAAQVPEPIYQKLKAMGQVVDVSCTAKLYRPMMPRSDYNTWWTPGAAAPDASKSKVYPGFTVLRDQRFGPHPKDVVDIFYSDRGGESRPVFIYVPGGGGNKIEQQVREANAFYDNIGRWGARNGFVVVTVQRHAIDKWDDGGRDIAAAVDWVKANVGKHHGDGNRIVMASHSAGTVPTGIYVGHPERWPNGVQIKGMIYISGAPIPTAAGEPSVAVAAGNPPQAGQPIPGSTCGANPFMGSTDGAISGPSGAQAVVQGAAPPRPPQLTTAEEAERDNLPGFLKTNVKLMLVRAELDPSVKGEMSPLDKAAHDKLCASVGPGAKDGQGRCPTMLYLPRHSHVSEVFAFDTGDKTVEAPILKFAREALAR